MAGHWAEGRDSQRQTGFSHSHSKSIKQCIKYSDATSHCSCHLYDYLQSTLLTQPFKKTSNCSVNFQLCANNFNSFFQLRRINIDQSLHHRLSSSRAANRAHQRNPHGLGSSSLQNTLHRTTTMHAGRSKETQNGSAHILEGCDGPLFPRRTTRAYRRRSLKGTTQVIMLSSGI